MSEKTKGTTIEFKIGDHVRIKSWDQMVEEFGRCSNGGITAIRCKCSFIDDMKHLCGRRGVIKQLLAGERVILEFEDTSGDTNWSISTDMIEIDPFHKANLDLGDIVKYQDGTIGIVLENMHSKDGKGIYTADNGCIGYLSDFNDDLTYHTKEGRNIVAIYKRTKMASVYSVFSAFFADTLHVDENKWTYKRTLTKELTVAEATELLKDKFPGVELKIAV